MCTEQAGRRKACVLGKSTMEVGLSRCGDKWRYAGEDRRGLGASHAPAWTIREAEDDCLPFSAPFVLTTRTHHLAPRSQSITNQKGAGKSILHATATATPLGWTVDKWGNSLGTAPRGGRSMAFCFTASRRSRDLDTAIADAGAYFPKRNVGAVVP